MIKNMKLSILTEHQEQAGFVSEVKARYAQRPDFVAELFFAVPNGMQAGGKNKFALVAKFKAEGMNPGVFDIHYLQPRGKYPFFCLEYKRSDKRNEKNGGLSPEQVLYSVAAARAGAFVCVAYTADEGVKYFEEYMNEPVRLANVWKGI